MSAAGEDPMRSSYSLVCLVMSLSFSGPVLASEICHGGHCISDPSLTSDPMAHVASADGTTGGAAPITTGTGSVSDPSMNSVSVQLDLSLVEAHMSTLCNMVSSDSLRYQECLNQKELRRSKLAGTQFQKPKEEPQQQPPQQQPPQQQPQDKGGGDDKGGEPQQTCDKGKIQEYKKKCEQEKKKSMAACNPANPAYGNAKAMNFGGGAVGGQSAYNSGMGSSSMNGMGGDVAQSFFNGCNPAAMQCTGYCGKLQKAMKGANCEEPGAKQAAQEAEKTGQESKEVCKEHEGMAGAAGAQAGALLGAAMQALAQAMQAKEQKGDDKKGYQMSVAESCKIDPSPLFCTCTDAPCLLSRLNVVPGAPSSPDAQQIPFNNDPFSILPPPTAQTSEAGGYDRQPANYKPMYQEEREALPDYITPP